MLNTLISPVLYLMAISNNLLWSFDLTERLLSKRSLALPLHCYCLVLALGLYPCSLPFYPICHILLYSIVFYLVLLVSIVFRIFPLVSICCICNCLLMLWLHAVAVADKRIPVNRLYKEAAKTFPLVFFFFFFLTQLLVIQAAVYLFNLYFILYKS